jgi:hypothetical protein
LTHTRERNQRQFCPFRAGWICSSHGSGKEAAQDDGVSNLCTSRPFAAVRPALPRSMEPNNSLFMNLLDLNYFRETTVPACPAVSIYDGLFPLIRNMKILNTPTQKSNKGKEANNT